MREKSLLYCSRGEARLSSRYEPPKYITAFQRVFILFCDSTEAERTTLGGEAEVLVLVLERDFILSAQSSSRYTLIGRGPQQHCT